VQNTGNRAETYHFRLCTKHDKVVISRAESRNYLNDACPDSGV
jgi:hypothetical protein